MTFAVAEVPLKLTSLVLLSNQHQSSRYERFQRHICLTTTAFSLPFHGVDLSGGGAEKPLTYPQYGLFFGDGVSIGNERARGHGTFAGNLGTEADGPYMLTIVPYDASGNKIVAPTECYVPFWIWIDRNGTAKNHPDVIFQNGTFDWVHLSADVGKTFIGYRWLRVPKTAIKTRIVPQKWWYVPTVNSAVNSAPGVPPRIFPGGEPFNTALPSTGITRLNFAPCTDDWLMNLHRPTVTKRGITVTENIQGYFTGDVFSPRPLQPIIDGPRGQATTFSPLSIWPGHSGKLYAMDAYSFYSISQDGTRTTLAGLRHPQALYWEDMGNPQGYDFAHARDQTNIPGVDGVGNWDASIPATRRFPWESWGFAFDARSTTVDQTAPLSSALSPPFPPLPPHASAPCAYSTCRFGRVLQYKFDKNQPTAAPAVKEWVTGLLDPWGIAIDSGVIYVAERGGNRISMWSADTPQTSLGNLIDNPTAGTTYGAPDMVGQLHEWVFPASMWISYGVPNLPVLRAQPILGPEGLAIMDGWCYWGAKAQGEVRRINLASKEVQVCCRPYMSWTVQSHWIELKVSDGSFGPRGTIFTTTFDNQANGRPRAWLPGDVTDTDGTVLKNGKTWAWESFNWNSPAGPGGTVTQVYGCAIGINNGMLACGSTGPGIAVYVKATLGESQPDVASLARGYAYYISKGYELIHGNYGYGYIDTPLPWGENHDCDYYLQRAGHSLPVAKTDTEKISELWTAALAHGWVT